MRKLLLILIWFAGIFTESCMQMTISNKKAKEKLEILLEVSISNDIKVSDYEISSDIHGKYTESFLVHFNNKDEYDKIFHKVKPSKSKYFDIYGYGVEHGNRLESGYQSISSVFNPKK